MSTKGLTLTLNPKGRPTILTPQEEKELVVTCQVLQQMGFGVTREILSSVVQDYLHDHLERGRYFGGNAPGFNWWQCFLRQWPDLKERRPQHLSIQRAKACSREILDVWYG